MSEKKACNGTCKKFRASKPSGKGRYDSGQARCRVCNIWIDHKGCHTRNASPATKDSFGWFCNCCNYKVSRHPRKRVYKEILRARQDSSVPERDKTGVDRLNRLVEKTLQIIKSDQNGIYFNDLKMLLDISQEEMSAVATKVTRVRGVSKKEIHHQEILQDILFTYHELEWYRMKIRNHKPVRGDGLLTWMLGVAVRNDYDRAFAEMQRQGIMWYAAAEYMVDEIEHDDYKASCGLGEIGGYYSRRMERFLKTQAGRDVKKDIISSIQSCNSYKSFAREFGYMGKFRIDIRARIEKGIQVITQNVAGVPSSWQE